MIQAVSSKEIIIKMFRCHREKERGMRNNRTKNKTSEVRPRYLWSLSCFMSHFWEVKHLVLVTVPIASPVSAQHKSILSRTSPGKTYFFNTTGRKHLSVKKERTWQKTYAELENSEFSLLTHILLHLYHMCTHMLSLYFQSVLSSDNMRKNNSRRSGQPYHRSYSGQDSKREAGSK